MYEVILHYKAKKEEKMQNVISVHLGIDPGPLVPKSDTLPLGHDAKSCAARNNRPYWTDNPRTGHIRIRMQGKNFACSIYLYLALRRSVLMKCQKIFRAHFVTLFCQKNVEIAI